MADLKTRRRYETKTEDNGLITVAADVCTADRAKLNGCRFHLSTAVLGCSMRAKELAELGYEAEAVVLPIIRMGLFDFINVPVSVSDANVIGASLIKWLNFSVSNSENAFEVDLLERIKPIVDKNINPSIKPAYRSMLKPSENNGNPDWHTWAEIDALFPSSWVLISGGDDELDYGGEVIWHSQTDTPDTSLEGTFLYCNKGVAEQNLFMSQNAGYIRCRGYSAPDAEYGVFIEKLEASLSPPVIDRFYYDPVSKQGKLFTMRKAIVIGVAPDPNAVLTQSAIDALFEQMLGGDDSVFKPPPGVL